MDTIPVGPLLLDLRSTSTLGKKKSTHIGKIRRSGYSSRKKNAGKKPIGECTRWNLCMKTVSKEKDRETKLLYKNQNISQSFGFLAGVYMIVTNSQFCTGV